jgi:hypothetical protein
MTIWVTLGGTCRVSWWHAGNIAVASCQLPVASCQLPSTFFSHSPSPGRSKHQQAALSHTRDLASTAALHRASTHCPPFNFPPYNASCSFIRRSIRLFELAPIGRCITLLFPLINAPPFQPCSYYYGTCLVIVSRNELSPLPFLCYPT